MINKPIEVLILKDGCGFTFYDEEYLNGTLFTVCDIPKLIKWLESVQKYNEFKNKQKRKKVKK